MHKTITFLGKIACLFFLLFNAGISSKSYGQCAGEDASLTSCDKETNQFIDLYAALGGTPVPGGTWTDEDNSGGLNTATGQLNTWLINRGGTFTYTYTVEGEAGCTDTDAIVTVTLAGYAGRDNNNAVACEDETNVNLFQFIGSGPNPTLFGTWVITSGPAGALNGPTFNAQIAGPGSYTFTYTVDAQGSCPATMSTVNLDVVEAPEAGTVDPAVTTIFCETDDLSSLTNFNLRDAIVGEDTNGVWSEGFLTNEINAFNDSFINIENIRDTYGPGSYPFTYTVQPTNPLCTLSQVTVTIIIEEVIDFSNATFELTVPAEEEDIICEDTLPIDAIATITGELEDIPNGDYALTYEVSPAPNTGTETLTITMTDGIGSFPINPDFFTGAGVAEVRVLQIIDPTTQNVCDAQLGDLSDTLTIVALPDVTDTELSVAQPLCFEENGVLTFSDATTTPEIELVDGDYTITYTLSNTTTSQEYTELITVAAGTTTLNLLAENLPTADDYTFSLSSITNTNGCATAVELSTTFTVAPKPDAQTLGVTIADTCEDEIVSVTLTDSSETPNLADGSYEIIYDISGAISVTDQTATVVITDGTGSFDLPQALLANGSSTLTLTSLLNSISSCEAENFTMPTATFNIVATPDASNLVGTVTDSCEDRSATVNLTTDATFIQDGDYVITYTLSGANTLAETTTNVTFTAGVAEFELAAETLAEAGTTSLTIEALTTASQSCDATGLPITIDFEVLPVPTLENTTISVDSVCLGEDALISFTNSDLADGSYIITYQVGEGTLAPSENVTFAGGEASITIDSELLINPGSVTVSIISIANPASLCFNDTATTVSFDVNSIPDLMDGDLSASDICLAEDGLVTITSSDLADGEYTIDYELAGANTALAQSATALVNNGVGSFTIPATTLAATGTTSITATLISSASGCTSLPLAVTTSFEVNPLPNATGVTVTATDVCLGEQVIVTLSGASALQNNTYLISYQITGATTSEIISENVDITNGAASIVLDANIFTAGGITTFSLLDIQNETSGCSATNLGAAFTDFSVEDPAMPSLGTNGGVFCINDNPTVTDLEANVSSSFNIITYDAASGGSVVSPTTPLMENTTYYIAAQNTATGCEGSQRLAVTADLSGCDSVFIPDGFSPNGDGINDVFEMQNINIVYPNYTIEIFNRNGAVVFKGDASTGFWNGQANRSRLGGNTLPNGVYFYIINYNDGQTSPKQGKVYLNR